MPPHYKFISADFPLYTFRHRNEHGMRLKVLKTHRKCEMVKFDKRIVAKILIFQLVNFDYLLVKKGYLNSVKKELAE